MRREVELAMKLLESKGYAISKKINESTEVLLPGTIIRFKYGLNGTAEIIRHHKGEYYFIKYKGDEEKLFKLEPGEYSIVSDTVEESTVSRGIKSTKEEKLVYARELLQKAKDTNNASIAWELVDFLHDTMLLKEL